MLVKNFDSATRGNAAAGSAMVTLYVDACMAANHVMFEYARLLTALMWQTGPLAAGIAQPADGATADARRETPGAAPRSRAAAAPPSRDAAPIDAAEAPNAPSPQTAPAAAVPRKAPHKKAAAIPRAGVAKRRVRASR